MYGGGKVFPEFRNIEPTASKVIEKMKETNNDELLVARSYEAKQMINQIYDAVHTLLDNANAWFPSGDIEKAIINVNILEDNLTFLKKKGLISKMREKN